MTSSGSYDFNPNRNEIIRQAALHVGAISSGETMSASLMKDFNHNLNGMVKHWQAKGIHIWTVAEGVLFPQPGQSSYAFGPNATDHAAFVIKETSVSADEATGQTVIGVTDTSRIEIGDRIGVVMTSGSFHWSTVSAKTSSTVTIDDALTDAATAQASVFFYTLDIPRPLRIVAARRYNVVTQDEIPVRIVSRREYLDIAAKTQAGLVNQVFYDPQITQGVVKLWPVPSSAAELLRFTWHRPIQDFDAATDTADLPQEWVQTLEFNLAATMSFQFRMPIADRDRLKATAEQYLAEVSGFDREPEPVNFQPDYWGW